MFVPRRRETLGRRQWTVVCRRDVQCRRRRRPQALSTGNPGDRLKCVGQVGGAMHGVSVYSPQLTLKYQTIPNGNRRIVCLDSTAVGIEPTISSRKSNALTTTPHNISSKHCNIKRATTPFSCFFWRTRHKTKRQLLIL